MLNKNLKNFSWVLLSNLVMAFSKWLILIILARTTDPNMVGIYALSLAIISPISLFSNYKLRSLFVSEENPNFGNFIFLRVVLDIISLIILMIISISLYPQYFIIILLISLIKIIDLHSELIYSVSHYYRRYNFYSKLIIGKYIVNIVVFGYFIYIFKNLQYALVAQLITQFLYLIYEYLITFYKFKITFLSLQFKVKEIKRYAIIGFPLGLTMFVVSFNASLPRYLLEEYYSTELLGIFATIAYLATIGNLFTSAITQNILPTLRRYRDKNLYSKIDDIVFKYSFLITLLLMIIASIITYLVGDLILLVIYGEEYRGYSLTFIVIVLSVLINGYSAILDNVLLTLKLIKFQYVISIFMLVINIITSFLLVLKFGILGAALTMLVVNIIQLIIRILYYRYSRGGETI